MYAMHERLDRAMDWLLTGCSQMLHTSRSCSCSLGSLAQGRLSSSRKQLSILCCHHGVLSIGGQVYLRSSLLFKPCYCFLLPNADVCCMLQHSTLTMPCHKGNSCCLPLAPSPAFKLRVCPTLLQPFTVTAQIPTHIYEGSLMDKKSKGYQ